MVPAAKEMLAGVKVFHIYRRILANLGPVEMAQTAGRSHLHRSQDGILSTVSLVMPKYSPLSVGVYCEGCHFLPFSSKHQNLYSEGHLIQRAL